jgi:hypothetical protein
MLHRIIKIVSLRSWAVPWLTRLVAGLSPQRPGFACALIRYILKCISPFVLCLVVNVDEQWKGIQRRYLQFCSIHWPSCLFSTYTSLLLQISICFSSRLSLESELNYLASQRCTY